MKRLDAKVIGLGKRKEKKQKEKLDQKWVWAIKRSITAVTKATAITKKTCCKKACIVVVRYTATITNRNAAKTHILQRLFFIPLQ